jgi:hypothetical protein
MCDPNIKNLLIIAPPESAKTTWTIPAYLGTYVGFRPHDNIILGSASGPIAEKRSLAVRGMVERPEWRAIFPRVRPIKDTSQGLKWEKNEWSVAIDGKSRLGQIHPTLFASGTGGPMIGARADLLMADDLLDYDNSRTQHQREIGMEWAHREFLSRRKSNTGRTLIIGTSWFPGDIVDNLRRRPDFVVCHVPLLGEGSDFYAYISYPDSYSGRRLGQPTAGVHEVDEREAVLA